MKCKRIGLLIGLCGAAVTALAGCNGGRFTSGIIPPPPPPPVQRDGATPDDLILGSDGNFYGTTQSGGQYGQGVVFRVTSTGEQAVLYAFVGGANDGAEPQGLIEGSDGNFYGTTLGGGKGICTVPRLAGGNGQPQAGCGTVFEVTPAGAESIVYFFSGEADGGAPNLGLAQASNGDLYGTAAVGGASGNGVAFQLTLGGVETVLHSFAGGASDGALPASLVLGTDGSLYGVTVLGGTSNAGTVFNLTLGGVETLLHSFAGGSDGENPSMPLVEGTDGNFYGTTPLGGASANAASQCEQGCGTVFQITPAGVETVLHAFAGGSSDGANPYMGLIEASDGNFYGTTSSGGNPDCKAGCGTAFSITSAGSEAVLHFFGASSTDGTDPSSALVLAADGSFYGTTAFGGIYNHGAVYTMTPAGVETVLFSFGITVDP